MNQTLAVFGSVLFTQGARKGGEAAGCPLLFPRSFCYEDPYTLTSTAPAATAQSATSATLAFSSTSATAAAADAVST